MYIFYDGNLYYYYNEVNQIYQCIREPIKTGGYIGKRILVKDYHLSRIIMTYGKKVEEVFGLDINEYGEVNFLNDLDFIIQKTKNLKIG